MSNQSILGRRFLHCSALALLVSASALAGCGQKGPLYMPPAPATPAAAPQAVQPATTDNKTKPSDSASPAAR